VGAVAADHNCHIAQSNHTLPFSEAITDV
jgi:hypothetical protein